MTTDQPRVYVDAGHIHVLVMNPKKPGEWKSVIALSPQHAAILRDELALATHDPAAIKTRAEIYELLDELRGVFK